MSNNRINASAFLLGLLLITFICLSVSSPAFALPEAGHVAVQNQYIWGVTTESGRIIHSGIIDKVPWRDNVGGYDHRKLWGHSEEWFYEGRIPKSEAIKNIKANLAKQNPALSGRQLEAEAQKIFKDAVSKTGQERIAEVLRKEVPSLTRKESMAMAEQLYDSHLIGDSTTAEGLRDMSETLKQRVMIRLSSPSPEALSAYNKSSMSEAIRKQGDKFSTAAYVRQLRNFEHLLAGQLSERGFSIYKPANKNDIGITVNGENYIIKTNWKDAAKTIEQSPSSKVFLADDVYAKEAGRHPELSEKIFPESQVTGVKETLAQQQEKMQILAENKAAEIRTAEANRTAEISKQMRQSGNSLRKIAPYAVAGGIMALSENWETITEAWAGKATWAKALTRTGVDFAGYTAVPYFVDGVLMQVGGKYTIAASLKNAGMGYTIGFFIWNAGKEYLSYRIGDISKENFMKRIKQRGVQAGRGAMIIPVNMLLCKLISPTAGTFFVPLVIIGGSFAIQRTQTWYEDKQWRETIYLDDVKAVFGEDLINEFTLMMPETRSNLAEPKLRSSFAEPDTRHSLSDPEEMLSY